MGKRTTTRHKEDNTFRFQTFEEKLRQISVNVNLSIRDGRGENPEGQDTYFIQEIEKWVDLNRTESFADLLCKIGTDVRTLEQVLLKKDDLAKHLLEHLQNGENKAAFEPTFALVVALSRDLGEEFYPHFQSFFKTIIKIVMESKETGIIEAGFKCYAYLSKYLRRQIIKDLQSHMKLFSCFLDPKLKTYVMIFACEAFSIVAGKFARDHPEKFLKLLFNIFLREHPEHAVGVATLLFSVFKGVAGTLKLEGPGMHFKKCILFLDVLEEDELDVWTDMLSQLVARLLTHAKASDCENFIKLMEKTLIESTDIRKRFLHILSVYVTMVEFNESKKLTDVASCAKVLHEISSNSKLFPGPEELLTRAVVSIVESKCSSNDTEILNHLLPAIVNLLKAVPFDLLEKLDKCLRRFRAYFRMFLEPVVSAYARVGDLPFSKDCPSVTVYCLSEAILEQGGMYQQPSGDNHYFPGSSAPMRFYVGQKRILTTLNASNIKGNLWDCCSFLQEIENEVNHEEISDSRINYYVRLLLVFSRLNSKNCPTCLQTCKTLLDTIVRVVDQHLKARLLPVIYHILQVFISQSSPPASFIESVPVKELLRFLFPFAICASSGKSFHAWSLKTLDALIHFINTSDSEDHVQVVKEYFSSEWDSLTGNLQSGFRMIRALTLSVMRNVIDEVEVSSIKMIEMIDKFLELENMSISDTKFSSAAKSTLNECKVTIESENYDINVKLVCLKYTLGFMYTNYSLVWTPCVDVLRQCGKHIEMSEHWKVYGKHFSLNQSYPDQVQDEKIRTTFLPSCDESDMDFLDSITIMALGLPPSDSGFSQIEEQLDILQYKVNLWLSLKGQPVTREEYSGIRPFVDKIIETSKEANEENNPDERKERAKLIIPVLQFLETCDLVNVNHDLWESALKYLTFQPDVQKAAWKFLFAKRKNKLKSYKDDIDEIINSESMDPVHKFRLDAIDVSLNKQYENETTERRALLMEIIIRILIGKERVMKGEKRTQVLRFLAGCTEDDAKKYLDLTVGSPQEVQHLPPKIIEIKINKMTSALRVWRYKFPNILDQIINGTCDLVCALSSSIKPISRKSFGSQDEIPDDVFEEQKKAALKAGRLCVVAFFTSLPRLNMKQETLSRIFDVFIWPALEDITQTSVGSVSWILKLFLVWSTHERYHILLTKCKNGDVHQSPMWRLFDLLDLKSTAFDVKKYILGIVLNLTNPPEISDESEEVTEDYLSCTSAPLNVSGTYTFETSESLGVNIILLRKEVILNLFQDTQIFKRFTGHTGGGNCLTLISLLAGFTSGGEMNEKLCSVIIDTFHMYKNNEENLYNSIVSVGKLLRTLENDSDLLLKFAPAFSWMNGRRLRTALVEALDYKVDSDLFELISGMNAWTDSAADTPDFIKRQQSFQKAENFINRDGFNFLTYVFLFYNSVYNINREDDLGMRNSAKVLLLTMAKQLPAKVSSNPNLKPEIHKILDSVIIPKLRGGVHEKDDKRYEDILRVLYTFIDSCKEIHGTFTQLAKVLTFETIEGLCDIQVHLRTRAMNRLCKKLKDCAGDIGPAAVQAFVIPMASHNLFDEERLSKNFNELIDASIEVLKTAMTIVSHDHYFFYLNRLLDDPKKNSRLAKQFERVLIAIMDAFHFDLSLACPEDNKAAETSLGACSLQNMEPHMEKMEVSKEKVETNGTDHNSEEESDKEEFSLPETTVEQALTLLPEAAAKKCLGILKAQIIPKLRKLLHFEEKATHKLSKSTKTVDNDVILKIPCTIALVKLLKKIPKSEGQSGIRSIIPSISAGLRNELLSVRNTLRKTLLMVIKELGTSHLRTVIGYLKSSLLRGYQKHVLNFSVAYLLRCLENELKMQPYHVPIKEVLSLCEEELYGQMHEEKSVEAIRLKTREASKSNAVPILKVCAKCVSTVEQLDLLIQPAVKHLTERKSLKVAKSSRQWLMSVGEGLAENNAVNHFELLKWLAEVIKRDGATLNNGKAGEDADQPPNKKRKFLETPVDSKIIPVLKKKVVVEGKVGGESLLTEFSFSCLYNGLNKGGRFRESLKSPEALPLLDNFVSGLADGMKGSSKQVNVIALRCLTLLMEFDLASFKKPEIIDKMQMNGFVAMNTHCYRNTTDSEMTNATFKFLSTFFVRFPDFKIVLQDFELMLKCIQGYLTDGNCSSSALTLLKGILNNKYKCAILPDLMQEVFKQCITSYYLHINDGCRQAYLVYLNNYLTNPKDLYLEVQLILRQLDYEHESGRVTAAGILNSLLQSIPEDCFEEVKELVFLKLLATLDKEKLPKARSQLGECIKSLFKLEKKKALVRILLKLLLLEKHVPELDTFFLIVGLLIEDPKIITNDDMAVIIKRIKDVLDPHSLDEMCSKNSSRITQQIKDYMIFQAVVAFKKALNRSVFDNPLLSTNSSATENLTEIFDLLRDTYLDYEHEWVPLIVVDILSIVLNLLKLTEEDAKESVASKLDSKEPVGVFLEDTEDLKQWISSVWRAMKKTDREDLLAKGAYALVILISISARLQNKEIFVETIDTIRKSVNGEVVHNPRVTTIRSVALGCFRGIAKTCPRDAIEQTVEIMTRVAVRELTDDNVPQDLKNECEKLISVMRDIIGNSEFNIIHAKVTDFYYKKRNINRAKKKETAMLHPGLVRKRPKKVQKQFQGKKKRKTN